MYNRGSCSNLLDTHWPNTWQDAMMLYEAAYKDPTTYYICLSGSQYCNWNLMKKESDVHDFWSKGHHPILLTT